MSVATDAFGVSAGALTFDDEFNTLNLKVNGSWNGWSTSYGWSPSSDFSAHTIAGESEVYVDPTVAGTGSTPLGINPFSVSNGVLSITAAQTPWWAQGPLWNQPYTSGLLTTQGTFEQTYGYFEMKAQMPAGKGAFPAFWLLSDDGKYSEIDVTEAVNGDNQNWLDLHFATSPSGTYRDGGIQFEADVANMSSSFHTYGVLWTAQNITWFVDGHAVASTPTPAVMNSPMYMLVDYAVGGAWAGAPDGSPLSPMQVDYVRAYSLSDTPTSITDQGGGGASTPPPPPPATGQTGTATSAALLSIGPNAATVDGGHDGYALFTVTRTGDLSGPSTASWSVSGAPAGDFGGSMPWGSVSFGQGESSKTVWVPIAGFPNGTTNDAFTVTLSDPSGASIANATASEVITYPYAGAATSGGAGGSQASAPVVVGSGSPISLSPSHSVEIAQFDVAGHDVLSVPTGAGGFQLSGIIGGQTNLNMVDASAWWTNISAYQVVRWTGTASAADSAARVDGLLQAMPGNQTSGMFVVGYTADDSHVALYYDSNPSAPGGAVQVATFDNIASTTALSSGDFQIDGAAASTGVATNSGVFTLTTTPPQSFNFDPSHNQIAIPTGPGGFQLAGVYGQTTPTVVDASAWWNNISGAQVIRWTGSATALDSSAKVDALLQAMPGNSGGGVLVVGYTADDAHVAIYYDSDPAHPGGASQIATIGNIASPSGLPVSDFQLFS